MNKLKAAGAIIGTATLATGLAVVGPSALPVLMTNDGGATAHAAEATSMVKSNLVQQEVVNGVFSFAQGVVTPVDQIRKSVAEASKYLCGSEGASLESSDDPASWVISVSGDVDNAYQATLGELSVDGAAQLVMGCTCAANGVDGLATANGDVLGVTMRYIMEQAGVSEECNTIVFTCADGYEVALPKYYVAQRYSLIAYNVNGEDMANVMGGTNQLWLGSTSANYFAQDIVDIRFETRENPPARPGTPEAGDAYANVPNVNVVEASE